MNALFIPAGSRLMRRSFGSDLQQLLFEPLDDTQVQDAAFRIREAALSGAPHVRIVDVAVIPTRERKTLSIAIKFSLLEDAVTDERRVLINKAFVSSIAAS